MFLNITLVSWHTNFRCQKQLLQMPCIKPKKLIWGHFLCVLSTLDIKNIGFAGDISYSRPRLKAPPCISRKEGDTGHFIFPCHHLIINNKPKHPSIPKNNHSTLFLFKFPHSSVLKLTHQLVEEGIPELRCDRRSLGHQMAALVLN